MVVLGNDRAQRAPERCKGKPCVEAGHADHRWRFGRSGVRVSDSYRQLLSRAGVTEVWIDDGLSKGIEPLETLSDATKQRASAARTARLRR